MKKFELTIKRIVSHLLTLSFLLSPSTFAQVDKSVFKDDFKELKSQTNNGTANSMDIMSGMNSFGQAANEYIKLKQNLAKSQQQAMEMKKLQLSLVPKESPDDFFPQCKILPSKSDKIAGMCESPLQSDDDVAEAMAAYQSAIQNKNLYENHIQMGNKAGDDQGLQCLNEQGKLLRSQLYERKKEIDEVKRQLEEEKAAFGLAVTNAENDLKEIQGLLTGSEGFKFNKNNRDLSGLFQDPACSAVVDFKITGDNAEALNGGLIGMRSKIEKTGLKESKELLNSKDKITREFRRDLNNFVNNLSRDFKTGKQKEDVNSVQMISQFEMGNPHFKRDSQLAKILNNTINDYNNDQKELKNELENLGISKDDPLTSQVFSNNGNLQRSLHVWERNINNECLARKVTSNLGNLKERAKERNQNISSRQNIEDFFSRIGSILDTQNNPNLTLDERMAEIKKLQSQYGYDSILVDVGSANIKRSSDKVSDTIDAFANDCKTEFNSRKNNQGFSGSDIKAKLAPIQAKFQDYQKNLAMNIAARMQKSFFECDGIEYSNTPADCNDKKLSTSSANFCMKQSLTCAQNISTCHAKADVIVKAKQQEQLAKADVLNKKIAEFKLSQYNKLKMIEAKYKGTSSLIQKYFPGSNFSIPTEISANPKSGEFSMRNELGVQLMDTKNFAVDMENNLKAISDAIDSQNKGIIGDFKPEDASAELGGIVGDKIKTIKANYESEQKAWDKLAKDCQSKVDEYIEMKNKAAEEQNKMTAENNQKIARFCSKITAISSTPGCGKVSDLTDEAFEIADEIGLPPADAKKLGVVGSYAAVCESSQGHDEENGNDAPTVSVSTLCKDEKYKKSDECATYNRFVKDCDDDYYTQAELVTKYAALGDSKSAIDGKCKPCTPDAAQPNKCSSDEYEGEAGKFYGAGATKAKCTLWNTEKNNYPADDFKTLAYCGKDSSERATKFIEVSEPLKDQAVKLANAETIKELRSQVGEQNYQVCNARADSTRAIAQEFGEGVAELENNNVVIPK